jgi:hypothetical protein
LAGFARLAFGALLVLATPALASPPDEVATEHFRFEPDAGAVGLADHLAGIAEAKRSYVLGLLGSADDRVIEVRIASDEPSMERMLGTRGPVREWISGLAFPDQGLVVLSARGNEVFGASDTFVHEIAHLYLASSLQGRPVPRWFQEGFAMLVAGEELGERLKTFLGAAATGSFLTLEELSDSFPGEVPKVHLAYAQSQLFVRWLQRSTGGAGVKNLVQALQVGMPFDLAFDRTFGGSPGTLWKRFERTVDPLSSWLVFATSAAVLWMLVMILFLWAYVRKRRRAAARKAMWMLQEQLRSPGASATVTGDSWIRPGPDEVQ